MDLANCCDFKLIDKSTKEVVISGELSSSVGINLDKRLKYITVSDDVLRKCVVGQYIAIEMVINGMDLSIKGNIVEIDGNMISIERD